MAIALGKFADLGDNGGTGSPTRCLYAHIRGDRLILAVTGAAVGSSDTDGGLGAPARRWRLEAAAEVRVPSSASPPATIGRNVYLLGSLAAPRQRLLRFCQSSGGHDEGLGACSDHTGRASSVQSTPTAITAVSYNSIFWHVVNKARRVTMFIPVASNCRYIGAM